MSARRHHRSRSLARRALVAAVVLSLALVSAGVLTGCDSDPPPPREALPRLTLDPDRIAAAKRRADKAILVRENEQRGWQCGYDEAWDAAIFEARVDTPARWRASAVGSALGTSLILLLIVFAGVAVLALVLPRLKRAPAGDARPADERTGADAAGAVRADDQGAAPDPEGVVGVARAVGHRALAALSRALRVDYLDRAAAAARAEAIVACRDIARRLEATRDSVEDLATETTAGASALSDAFGSWLDEVTSVHDALVAHRRFAAALDPARVLPRLERTRRVAVELRREAVLAELSATGPDAATWTRWAERVADRPELPVISNRKRDVSSWVRPTGWAGLAGLALGVPMCAAWMAAGAFPLFFALLFCVGSLGALLVARIALFQAGRLPLLPGVADRVARVMTWLGALTTLFVVASSATTAESGLDLGDPPPIEKPAGLVPPPLPLKLPPAILDSPRPPTPTLPPALAPPAPPTPEAPAPPPE